MAVSRVFREMLHDGSGCFEITGVAGAEAYLNTITANRMPRRLGGIVLAHYLSDEGRIAGESTITRLAPDRFYVLSGAGAEDRDLDALVQGPRDGLDVAVANVTGDWGVLVLAGPRSREVLAKLTDAELGIGHFRWLTDRKIRHRPAPFPHKYYGGRVGLYQERRRGQGGMGSPGRRCCPRRKRAANRLLRHRLIHSPLRLRLACMRHSQLEGDAPTVAASIAKRHGTWSCYP